MCVVSGSSEIVLELGCIAPFVLNCDYSNHISAVAPPGHSCLTNNIHLACSHRGLSHEKAFYKSILCSDIRSKVQLSSLTSLDVMTLKGKHC
jgi:hypothetical protein